MKMEEFEVIKEKWKQYFSVAEDNMKSHTGKKVLIECAAQHPLVNGEFPAVEFENRLKFSFELYKKYRKEGFDVKIYVPGSRHKFNEVCDKISLSLAGKKYLIGLGMSPSDIYSVQNNFEHKGFFGVYNSADECYVASEIFKTEGFDKLISVGSPAQMYRKTLFYVKNGVLPLNFSVPTENMFHSYYGEIFNDIPRVIESDDDCQNSESQIAVHSRNERCPYLKNKIKNLSEMNELNFDLSEFEIDKNELEEDKKLQNTLK